MIEEHPLVKEGEEPSNMNIEQFKDKMQELLHGTSPFVVFPSNHYDAEKYYALYRLIMEEVTQ